MQTIRKIPIKQEKPDFSPYFHDIYENVEKLEFIGGFYPKKHVSILASKAGIGKTWYLVKLMTDLSNGGTIFLNQSYNEPPRKILYFCGETNIALIIDRFRLLVKTAKQENIKMVSYQELAKNRIFLDLDTKDGAYAVKTIIDQYKPDIAIFDSMMSFRRDDENTSQSTKDMMSRLIYLAEQTGTAILATHHLRKGTKKDFDNNDGMSQDEIIGSSALVRMAGTAFIMSKNYKAIKLQCVKSWWKEPPQLLYEMREINGGIDFNFSSEEDDMTEKRLRAERWIKNQRKNGGIFSADDLIKSAGISRPLATLILKDCEPLKMIDHIQYYK